MISGRPCFLFIALGVLVRANAYTLTPPPQTYVLETTRAGYATPQNGQALKLGSSFTLECWVYRDSSTNSGTLLGRASWQSPEADYALQISGDQVYIAVSNGAPTSFVMGHPADLPVNQWTHVAGVLEGGVIRLYLNGVKADEKNGAPTPSPSPASEFDVASLLYGQGGIAMRQARVWSRALTAGEITDFAKRALTGNEPGLVADWPLDDGSGQTGRDVGPNGLPLRLGSELGPDEHDPRWARAVILDTGPYYTVDTSHLNDVPSKCSPLACGMANAAVIDFNHDGLPDVLAFTADGQFDSTPVIALRNDGGGHFTDVTTEVFPGGVPLKQTGDDGNTAVADFNGDGLPDVYLGDGGPDVNGERGGQSKLFFTTPDGHFVDATANLPQIKSWQENGSAAALHHSGVFDILTDIGGADSAGPLLDFNDGTGHFTGDQSRIPYAPNILSVRAVDVNNKGVSDIVLGVNTGGGLPAGPDLLFLNDGTGHFHQAPVTALPPREFASQGGGTANIRIADIDGDGWQDLVEEQGGTLDLTGAGASARLILLLNNHDGTFRDASTQIPADPTEHGLGIETLVDLNGDGKTDLIVPGGVTPRLLYNVGGRFLDGSDALPFGLPQGLVLAFDVFGDGRTSIFVLKDNGYAIARNVKNLDPEVLERQKLITPAQASPVAPIHGGHP